MFFFRVLKDPYQMFNIQNLFVLIEKHIWPISVIYNCIDSQNKHSQQTHADQLVAMWGKVNIHGSNICVKMFERFAQIICAKKRLRMVEVYSDILAW